MYKVITFFPEGPFPLDSREGQAVIAEQLEAFLNKQYSLGWEYIRHEVNIFFFKNINY